MVGSEWTDGQAPIDREHLADMSGGDIEFEGELMQEFLNSTPQLLADLRTAIDTGDSKTAEISAHTLKGSCRSLGANPMSDPCQSIEHLAREGNLTAVGDLLKQVHEHYDVLCRYIDGNWNTKAA